MPECVAIIVLYTNKKSDFSKALSIYLQYKAKIDTNDLVYVTFVNQPPLILKDFQTPVNIALDTLKSQKWLSPIPNQFEIQELVKNCLQNATDLLSERIRQLGSNISRILFISDYPQFSVTPSIQTITKTASGLGISIDVCLFHEEKGTASFEEYGTLADTTRGEFGHFFKTKALFEAMKGFASKKITETSPIRLLSPEEKRDDKALAELATPLQFLSQEFRNEYESKKATIKCQVCFGNKCPIDSHDFLVCGRLCPNCGRPFHLHCAGMWAQKAEVALNLFRCPACYTLLKLPPSIQAGLKIKETRKAKNIASAEIKMIRAKSEGLSDTIEVCSYCYNSLNSESVLFPDQQGLVIDQNELKIFKCSACAAHYHTKCLESMYKESKACKNCGGIIK